MPHTLNMKFILFYKKFQILPWLYFLYLFLYSRFWWWISYYRYFPKPTIYAQYDIVSGEVGNPKEANFYSDTDHVPFWGIAMRRSWEYRVEICLVLFLIQLFCVTFLTIFRQKEKTKKQIIASWLLFFITTFVSYRMLLLELSHAFF
jgi:hypothetical protein